jgi:hypothetical protein
VFLFVHCYSIKVTIDLVLTAGLEPARPKAEDFESSMSAIPSCELTFLKQFQILTLLTPFLGKSFDW